MTRLDALIDTLDPDQRRAVLHGSGPLLLVAGAGSGKTRVIVARIVRLLRDGVPAKRILGITFTNRAADEMRERVAKAVAEASARTPAAGDLPWLGTFHAFGALLLRRFGTRIGLSPRFLIYDARDQFDVLRQILKDLDIDEKKFPPGRFAALIERGKRDGVSIEEAAVASGWLFVGKAESVGRAYDEALASAGALDFTDLIRLPAKLFREAPDVLDAVRSEVRHLLVDEFQDVDRAQARLTKMLATGADSFCAVGDEDQSIYGWRGGSAGPMLSFEADHPGATVVHLRTNYRTRAAILSAAGAVIAKNRVRREKEIVAAREGGERPGVRVYEDADAEAREVALGAVREIRRGVNPSEVAVFYRVNAQSRPVEDALRSLSIPYVLRGALSFYDRAAVRDAVAYLKWILHPEDIVMLKRALKAPRRGVGDVLLGRAREAAKRDGTAVSAELAKIPQLAPLFALRERWLAELPGRGVGEAFRVLLDGAGYLEYLERKAEEAAQGGEPGKAEDDRENLQELMRMADRFPGDGEEAVEAFLEKMSLSAREDGKEEEEAVRLMTMHNAKGLEFSVVFLIGLEEGLLPHSRSGDEESEVEEERRLFYVGLTRARERAFLSLARRRFLFGSVRDAVPSRFLSEMPFHLVSWESEDRGGRSTRTTATAGRGPQRSWMGKSGTAASPGRVTVSSGRTVSCSPETDESGRRPRRVRHPVFGEGQVEATEGQGMDEKIIVRFPRYGLKKILVRAAKMDVLY